MDVLALWLHRDAHVSLREPTCGMHYTQQFWLHKREVHHGCMYVTCSDACTNPGTGCLQYRLHQYWGQVAALSPAPILGPSGYNIACTNPGAKWLQYCLHQHRGRVPAISPAPTPGPGACNTKCSSHCPPPTQWKHPPPTGWIYADTPAPKRVDIPIGSHRPQD